MNLKDYLQANVKPLEKIQTKGPSESSLSRDTESSDFQITESIQRGPKAGYLIKYNLLREITLNPASIKQLLK
jgi:hypothetical protein